MDTTIKIRLFGGFEILVNGNPVMGALKQSRKTRSLIEYLILKSERPVSQEELIETLWESSERGGGSNPHAALRTMMHRLRTMAEQSGAPALRDAIETNRGAYRWNPAGGCEVDVLEFDRLNEESKSGTLTNRERIVLARRMIELYRGPLLPESSAEKWVSVKSVYYHDLYLETVFRLIDLLKTEGEYGEVALICRSAMDVDLYDERLHNELMAALVKTGKNREALSQYYFSSELQYSRFGVRPAREVQDLYESIASSQAAEEESTDEAFDKLCLAHTASGPMVGDISVFPRYVEIQRGMMEEAEQKSFFVLFSAAFPECDAVSREGEMHKIEQIAKKYLRRCDALSRYTARQYVFHICRTDGESAEELLGQIRAEYYSSDALPGVTVSWKLRSF